MSEKLYFTNRGLLKLRKEIEVLEKALQDLQSQVAHVAEVGGNQWHDNASYDALVIDIRGADWRLGQAMQSLKQAVLISPPANLDHVAIGTRVRLLRDCEEMVFEVAGYGEFDEELDLIAYNTPLVSPIMGKTAGETVTCHIGGKKTELKILEISKGGG
jgi:transcription elongation GreA/GreB family factor